MQRNIIIFALTFFICSSQLIAEAFTDEELINMSLYELETLKKNQLQKSQKKLVKTLLKDQKKEIESCEFLLESYYAMPYEDFINEQKFIKSKTQKKLYKKIAKIRKKYLKLKSQNSPKFRIYEDEFSGTIKFKTNRVKPIILSKGDCPNLKGAFAKLNYSSNDAFLRGSLNKDASYYLQIYITYKTYNEDAFKQYYGIRKAISKSTGQEMKIIPIDVDYKISESGFDTVTRYTMEFGIKITIDELAAFASNKKDEKIKIYSNAGDFIVEVTKDSFSSFYRGIRDNKILRNRFLIAK